MTILDEPRRALPTEVERPRLKYLHILDICKAEPDVWFLVAVDEPTSGLQSTLASGPYKLEVRAKKVGRASYNISAMWPTRRFAR